MKRNAADGLVTKPSFLRFLFKSPPEDWKYGPILLVAYLFFDFDEGLQLQDTQPQSTDLQFYRMPEKIDVAAVSTDGSKQVKRPEAGHEKLMARSSHVCRAWSESPVSLPSVVSVKGLKSQKEAVNVIRSARVDQIEIEGGDWCTMKNSRHTSDYDEIQPMVD